MTAQAQDTDNDAAFDTFESDWSKLCKTYNSVSYNALGYQHAQQGQYKKAVSLWRKASEEGYGKAQFNLGLSYELGKGVDRDATRVCVLQVMNLLTVRKMQTRDLMSLHRIYLFLKAAEYYRLAASVNHAKGLYNLGVMYLLGTGGLQKDPKHALSLLESAAMQGMRRVGRTLLCLVVYDKEMDKSHLLGKWRVPGLHFPSGCNQCVNVKHWYLPVTSL